MEFKSKRIEGLPYKKINKILNLKLSGNRVHLSKKAIAHIQDKHPDDYKICFGGIEQAICSPDYIGQSPFHKTNYELVKLTDKGNILVAMSSVADKYGYYPIESAYLLEKSTLMRRVRIKHLAEFK